MCVFFVCLSVCLFCARIHVCVDLYVCIPCCLIHAVEYNVLLTGFDVATADSARSAAKTSASGRGSFFFDGISIRYYVTISGLSGPPTAIDLYLGAGKGFLSQWNSSFSFMDTFDGVLVRYSKVSPSRIILTCYLHHLCTGKVLQTLCS